MIPSLIPAGLWRALGAVLCLCAAFGAGWAAGAHNARQAAALDAERGRAENIDTSREIGNDVQNLDDDAFGADLDGRLSAPRD